MINLHTGQPNEVSSPGHLTFFVGNPPRQMQIFSGIAIANWDSQERLDFADVFVHLNVPTPGRYPDDWEYTATTSLAHIDADGDEDFTFLTDECSVVADENTGELGLYAKIAVLGTPAHLVRFSYHIEVLSKIPVQGLVMGTIRWNRLFGDPVAAMAGQPMFRVGPATWNPGGGLGGGGGLPGWSWDEQYTVGTSIPPQLAGNEWIVPYSISGLPLDKELDIRPDLQPGTLNGPPYPFASGAGFTPLTHPVTLTAAAPSAVGQDFEMTFSQGPA